jgi:hypothetical protein
MLRASAPLPQTPQKSLKNIDTFKSQLDWPAAGSEEEKKLIKKLTKRQRPANLNIQKQQERVKNYVDEMVKEKKKNTIKYLINNEKSPSSLMRPVHNVKQGRLFPDHITALRKVKMDLDPTKADMDVMKNFRIAGDVYNEVLDRQKNNEYETFRDVISKLGINNQWETKHLKKKMNDRGVAYAALRSGSLPTLDLESLGRLIENDDELKIFKPDPLIILRKTPSKIASIKKRLEQQIIPDNQK